MKKILPVLAIIFAALAPHTAEAQLTIPFFSDLRVELTNQIAIASSAPTVDTRLIKGLTSTLKTLDKNTNTSLVLGTKTLGLLVKSLNRSSLSNVFNPGVQLVVDLYVSNYFSAQSDLSARLFSTFPGKARTSAQTAIDKLTAAINAADTNFDSAVAAKALLLAGKSLIRATKSVVKAEAAPAPNASVTATLTRSSGSAVNFESEFGGLQVISAGNFVVNVSQLEGTTLHVLFFGLSGLVEGANTVDLSSGTYTITSLDEGAYNSTGGSAQVNWDSSNKSVFGTFSFNVQEQDGPRTGTVSGQLTLYYQ